MKKIIIFFTLLCSLSIFSQNETKNNDNKIYNTSGIDTKPEYQGGLVNFNNDIIENLQKTGYKTKSKIYIMFIIEKDGSLTDIQVLRPKDKNLTEKLISIFQNLPNWNPGKQNGKIVRVKYSIPPITLN